MSKKTAVLDFYKQASADYASHLRSKPYEHYRNASINQALLSSLPSLHKPKVLDAGCGTGEFVFPLLREKYGKSLQLHGYDLSPDMLAIARKKFPFARLRSGPAEKLPYINNTFDLVISRETLEHLEHPQQAVREFYRVLQPGGCLVVSTPSWFGLVGPFYWVKRLLKKMQHIDNWWTPFSLRRTLRQAGFRIDSFTSVCPFLYHDVLPRSLLPLIRALDRFLLCLPGTRYFGRVLIFRCKK